MSPGRLSWFSTWARLVGRSPRIAPVYLVGTVISSLTIGSRRVGRQTANAFLKAYRAAVLNAASDESTSWYLPKYTSTARSWMRYPARAPRSITSLHPFSIAGRQLFGLVPPTTWSMNARLNDGSSWHDRSL